MKKIRPIIVMIAIPYVMFIGLCSYVLYNSVKNVKQAAFSIGCMESGKIPAQTCRELARRHVEE